MHDLPMAMPLVGKEKFSLKPDMYLGWKPSDSNLAVYKKKRPKNLSSFTNKDLSKFSRLVNKDTRDFDKIKKMDSSSSLERLPLKNNSTYRSSGDEKAGTKKTHGSNDT